MSVNVVERILCPLLPAAGLVDRSALPDSWKSGEAIEEITKARLRDIEVVKVNGSPTRLSAGAFSSSKKQRIPKMENHGNIDGRKRNWFRRRC